MIGIVDGGCPPPDIGIVMDHPTARIIVLFGDNRTGF